MKAFLAQAIVSLVLFAASALANPTTLPARLPGAFAPQGNLKGFTAEGEWAFQWPKDLVPMTIKGYELVDQEAGVNTPEALYKLSHRVPLVFRSNATQVEVCVYCDRQIDRHAGGPIQIVVADWTYWSRAVYTAVEFHKLTAAWGTVSWVDAVAIKSPISLFIFRDEGVLYRVVALGKSSDACKTSASDIAEAIYVLRHPDGSARRESMNRQI